MKGLNSTAGPNPAAVQQEFILMCHLKKEVRAKAESTLAAMIEELMYCLLNST